MPGDGNVGICSGYGLTEAPIIFCASVRSPSEKLANTEGQATPGVDCRVVTLDGTMAGPNEEGEIRVKGPMVMAGYVDASLDAAAFDEDGYFRTGDLGYLDEDGFVVICGRLKDVIIRKGENISAKAVEDVLHTSPKVAEAAVIGLADDDTGERACAVVVTAPDAEPLSFDEMIELCSNAGLMKQMYPEQLELADSLPRNPTGKVLKHKMREIYGERPFSRD
jgi:acyl-CoA synthetase (AMP-forming)/AMP-acid ligase II